MIPYSAVSSKFRMGAAPAAFGALPEPAAPPTQEPVFAGYGGVPGFLEALGTLSVLSAAAWIGVRTGLEGGRDALLRGAGWATAVGAAALGVFYIAGKASVDSGLPSLRVHPPA